MPRSASVRATLLVLAISLFAGALAACAGPVASPTPEPTEGPTPAPVATPTRMPGGPLSGEGALGRGTYETPAGFEPAFAFEVRSDAWRTITQPDEFGFVLVTPNALNAEAFIGVVTPTATSIEQFTGEMGNTGFLDGTESIADVTIGDIPARSISINRTTPSEAFTIRGPDGISQAGFGGDLPVNQFIYVAHPDGAFVVLLNMAADADLEVRFVFDALVDSIAFK